MSSNHPLIVLHHAKRDRALVRPICPPTCHDDECSVWRNDQVARANRLFCVITETHDFYGWDREFWYHEVDEPTWGTRRKQIYRAGWGIVFPGQPRTCITNVPIRAHKGNSLLGAYWDKRNTLGEGELLSVLTESMLNQPRVGKKGRIAVTNLSSSDPRGRVCPGCRKLVYSTTKNMCKWCGSPTMARWRRVGQVESVAEARAMLTLQRRRVTHARTFDGVTVMETRHVAI